MSEPFVGEIRMFGFNFAPKDWAFCDGQLMPISQNPALFSILGTNFGGNGTTTFGLPNMQGAAPMQQGQAGGFSRRNLGDKGGKTQVTLTSDQLPVHAHAAQGGAGSSQGSPAGNIWGSGQKGAGNLYVPSGTNNVAMNAQLLDPVGGGQAHNNVPPYLAVNFCIALVGMYPPRS